ncbi:hypothetical protein EVJ58_g1676 [Rhodofomes roseus]|uniref:Uncharacterized protein n=1 Tax=Rhodofomes roseus TaxID=34475 RepID=A0A4Y9YY97_9APHY|nr:hypothetical protein EVJ58_g1676 [Rhodofomes roseus]
MRKRKAAAANAAGAPGSGDVPPMTGVAAPLAPSAYSVVPYDVPQSYAAIIGQPISGKYGALPPSSTTDFSSMSAGSATYHARTDSTSNTASSDMRQTVVTSTFAMPAVLEPEEDAGRVTTALRPPPAYRSSWDDRQ